MATKGPFQTPAARKKRRAEIAKETPSQKFQLGGKPVTAEEFQARRDELGLTGADIAKGGVVSRGGVNFVGPMNIAPQTAEIAQRTGINEAAAQQSIDANIKAEQELRKKEFMPIAEEAGVFEDRPELVELDPTEEEKIIAGRGVINKIKNKFLKGENVGNEELGEFSGIMDNPETPRQIMLNQIQIEEINKARTASQKVGARVETFVGDLAAMDVDIGGFVSKFARMPMEEANQIVEQIKELEGTISGMGDASAQGEIGNPGEVLKDLAGYEEEIFALEGRLKRLIIESQELRANPEQVNIIEKQVLSAKETIFESKQRAGEGALITPSDSQLYFKLQSLRNS